MSNTLAFHKKGSKSFPIGLLPVLPELLGWGGGHVKSKAYAAGTVVNAIATGFGSAFGIDLTVEVNVSVEEDLKRCILIEDGVEREDKVVEGVLGFFGVKGVVEVKSEIPKGSGLGSSSAFMNALITSTLKFLGRDLVASEILKLNSKLSLKYGISYTGAFDDASASLLGGIVVTDNGSMRLLRWDVRRGRVAVLIPEWGRGRVSVEEIRRNPERVKRAVELAMKGIYREAMLENSYHYCERIGYPLEVLERVKDVGCCVGLSGNGPAFVAFGGFDEIRDVKMAWEDYGMVLVRKLVREPSEDVVITESLFQG